MAGNRETNKSFVYPAFSSEIIKLLLEFLYSNDIEIPLKLNDEFMDLINYYSLSHKITKLPGALQVI